MKRNRKLVVSAIAVILASGLGLGGLVVGGSGGGSAIAAAFADPLAMLALRSPGARKPGALFQIKEAKAPVAFAAPRSVEPEPEMSDKFIPLGEPQAEEGPVAFAAPMGDPFAGPGRAFAPGLPDPLTGSSGGSTGGGSSTGGPPSSSGGPPSSSGGPPSSSGGEPPVSPVPEPGTWVMMLLGMFGLGGAMRLGRRREALSGQEQSASVA